MTRPINTAGRYTVTTNANEANDETYMNWRTFNVKRTGKGAYNVSVLSNVEGNGQCWNAIGTIESNCFMVTEFASHSTPFSSDALLLTCVALLCDAKGVSHNARFIGTFPMARIWKIKKSSKVTAAPSLLRPTEVRDRNVNEARLKANERFAALMAMGKAKNETRMNRFMAYNPCYYHADGTVKHPMNRN